MYFNSEDESEIVENEPDGEYINEWEYINTGENINLLKTKSKKSLTLMEIFPGIILILSSVIVLLLFVVSIFVIQTVRYDIDNDVLRYALTLKTYDENYIEEIDKSVLVDNSISLLAQLVGDKYGGYVAASENKTVDSLLSNTAYRGIGITISYTSNGLTILSVFPNSPAAKVNLRGGDIITHINNKEVTEENYKSLLASEPKEDSVTYRINGVDTRLEYTEIIPKSIRYEKVNQVGIISIDSFIDDDVVLFKEIIIKAKEDGVEKIVFDVRNNPGGSLGAVLNMLDYITPEGVMAYTATATGENNVYTSDSVTEIEGIPVVVLVDSESASASELFSMCLQDLIGAKVVGETTYGKGTITTIFSYDDSSFLVMSIGKYLPESKREIEGVGVIPDVKLSERNITLFASELVRKGLCD